MLISRQLIFVHYPRTGGASIQQYLQEARPDTYYPLADPNMKRGQKVWAMHQGLDVAHQYARHLGLDPTALPILVCIRNPYSLVLSGYTYLSQRWKGQSGVPASFAAYLEELATKTPQEKRRKWDRDAFGQYHDYLTVGGQTPKNLTIARFENLVEDVLGWYREALGEAPGTEFPHKNASRHQHFSRYYGEAEERLVYGMWKNAFERGLYRRYDGLGELGSE